MSVVENVKEIADLIKKAGDVELYRRIVNLEGEVLDLTRRNRELENMIEELQRTLNVSKKLCFRAPFYWAQGDGVPYCPRCWEEKQKTIHAHSSVQGSTWYQCPVCQFGGQL